jgi:hypothetical protein
LAVINTHNSKHEKFNLRKREQTIPLDKESKESNGKFENRAASVRHVRKSTKYVSN